MSSVADGGDGTMRGPRLADHRVAPERTAHVPDAPYRLDGRGWLGTALDRRPAATSLIIVAVIFVAGFLVTIVGGTIGAAVLPETVDFAGTFTDVVISAAVLGLLGYLGWFRAVGFTGPREWRSLPLFILPALLVLFVLVVSLGDADLSDPARVAVALPQPFLTGFWEEGLMRGFLLFVLLVAALRSGRGPIAAVVASSLVFGLLHLVNLGEQGPAATTSQVISATFIGIGFAVLVLRTNALWLVVALHALYNFGGALRPPGDEGGDEFNFVGVLLSLLLAIYGLVLLRGGARRRSPEHTSG